jgi:hypothetical protein
MFTLRYRPGAAAQRSAEPSAPAAGAGELPSLTPTPTTTGA